jgi:hypothetical protein
MCDFGDVADAMFEGDERQCQIIFIKVIKKSKLHEFAKVMLHVGEWP